MDIKKDALGIVIRPNKPRVYNGWGGGDSLAYTSHYLYLSGGVENLEWFHYMFDAPGHKGNFVRHPNPLQTEYGFGSWVGGTWAGVISRDQLTGALCYMAKCKDLVGLWNTLKAHGRRLWLFANNVIKNNHDPATAKRKLPDLTLFDIHALYIRGFRAWPLYPLLLLFDLQLIGSAVAKRLSSDTDIISLTLKIITACEIMPTGLGRLAGKVLGEKETNKRLKSYWCGWRDQCGMYDLYVPYVKKYFR